MKDAIRLSLPEEVVVIGAGRLAKACLASILRHTSKVRCIEPDDTGFPVLKNWCEHKGVPYRQILNRKEVDAFFLGLSARTIVVSAYNIHLFSRAVLAKPNLTIINFHNSILPRHRGRNSPTWSIFEMDEESGVTWHLVSDEVDKGNVVRDGRIKLDADLTALQLTQQTLELGAQLFDELAPELFNGELTATKLVSEWPETFHLAKEVPNEGIFDLQWPLGKAYAFLRSLDYANYPIFPAPKVLMEQRSYEIVDYALRPEPREGQRLEDGFLLWGDGQKTLRLQLRELGN